MERPEVDWPQESLDPSTRIPLIVLFISQLCFFMHAGSLGGGGGRLAVSTWQETCLQAAYPYN